MDSPKLKKACLAFAKAECANCHDGQCIPQDVPCCAYIPDCGVCTWFLNAVLPLDKPLLAAVKGKMGDAPAAGKKCTVCGKVFIPGSNRQRYCPDCAREAKRAANARRVRNHRAELSM